jgi:amidase
VTITDLDADALSRAIHAKEVSCREVMRATLDRIAAVNPHVNAIVSLQDEADLLRQADARDAALARGDSLGWMHGMPQAIKDAAETKGSRARSARRCSPTTFPTTMR